MFTTDRSAPTTYHAAVVFFLFAAFLLSHAYTGVRHDGILYAGDAIARLIPGRFSDDLYFHFGSQGQYTLLPAAYAALIRWFGLGDGTIVGMLIAFALYVSAVFALTRAIAPRRWIVACMLSVMLGWSLYGGTRIFGYAEPFLTSRSFAEPLILFGFALLIKGRMLGAACVALLALVIHPLLTAPALLIAWCWLVRRDRRWWIVMVAICVGVMLAGVLRIGPFSDVFSQYDSDWLAGIEEINPQALLTSWSLHDFGIVAFDVALLSFVIRLSDPEDPFLRPFAIAVLTGTIVAFAASLLLVDILHNPFFGKIQLWRAQWCMQWLAMCSLPLVLRKLFARGEHGKTAAVLLALAWAVPFTIAPTILAAIAMAIDMGRSRFSLSRGTTRIVGGVALVAVIVVILQYEARVLKMASLFEASWHAQLGQVLAINVVLLPVVLVLIHNSRRFGRAALVVALVALTFAGVVWDQRSKWTRVVESHPIGTTIWPGLIEPQAKVFWYRDLLAPWVLLGHANYYTQQQGSGAVFSRELVIELERRAAATSLLDFQEQICQVMNNLNERQASCGPDAKAIASVCKEAAIDYFVLQTPVDGAKAVATYSTGIRENGFEKQFFLYRCSTL